MTLTEALDDLQNNKRKSANDLESPRGDRALQIVNRALANKSFKDLNDLSKFLDRYGIERTRSGWEMPDVTLLPKRSRPASMLNINYVTLQDGTMSDVTVQKDSLVKSASVPKHEASEADDALSMAYLSLNALKAGYDQTESELMPRDQQIYREINQAISLIVQAKQHTHQARAMLRKSF